MKSLPELKFDTIATEVFHLILKPLGFKRKGNNYYLKTNGFGKIINLQKSIYNSKDTISFTINIGFFLPEYWIKYYNYYDKTIPDFPTETDCILRKRIGRLINSKDTWYEINGDTNIEEAKALQAHNLKTIILPYFNRINSNEDLLNEIAVGNALALSPIAKLFMLGKMQRFHDFQIEYNHLLYSATNSGIRGTIEDLAKSFGITIIE